MKTVFVSFISVFLMCTANAQDQDYYDNVVIVLDASGSMTEEFPGTDLTRWEAAKLALRRVVSQLPENTHVGMYIFSDAIAEGEMVLELGPKNEIAMAAALESAEPYGTTPLGVYLKYGADTLLQARQEQYGYGSYRLLVVTDGQASDEHLVTLYTPDLLSRGIVLDVVGVAMARDHMLKRSANSYRNADDPRALQEAVQQIFAEVSVGGDDTVGDDAFEVLSDVPDEFAMSLLQSLTTSYGNHPIGTKPGSRATSADDAQDETDDDDSFNDSSVGCSVVSLAVSSGAIWLAAGAIMRRRRVGAAV